ncbi:MAG: DUF5777 family beta-barrel protein [Cyclobacteriaceae bacterium]|nr:MAG: DUF5777 family beta-barrel protein [Cyclobacteriaceae bacterium]
MKIFIKQVASTPDLSKIRDQKEKEKAVNNPVGIAKQRESGMKMSQSILSLIFILISILSSAQDDLLNDLTKEPVTNETIATFKGSRVINLQSVETRPKGTLEFIFSHRFGRINQGAYTLWGLDDAYVRLGLEYGITDRLGVGLGRNSIDKSFDAFARYKLLAQHPGKIPVSVTALGTLNYKSSPKKDESIVPITANDRISYVGQLLIARKFTPGLSLQVNPIIVHRNTVDQQYENNDDFALGFAGRQKISRSMAFTAEYLIRLNSRENDLPAYERYNAIGFGIDIETGGHVFQLVFTNSLGLIERSVVAETSGNFWDGDIHFGFNVTRTFQLSRKK